VSATVSASVENPPPAGEYTAQDVSITLTYTAPTSGLEFCYLLFGLY